MMEIFNRPWGISEQQPPQDVGVLRDLPPHLVAEVKRQRQARPDQPLIRWIQVAIGKAAQEGRR